MKTYQDLLAVGNSDTERAKFCKAAVNAFMGTRLYKDAQIGEAYYNKHNLTIEQFQKVLHTLSGNTVVDTFSANYKLKTKKFRKMVIGQVQYVLGNGLFLQEQSNKEKLGANFDFQLQNAAKRAMASGRAFGFWNLDHLEIFGFADTPSMAGFCPLYDEKTSELAAGIRYWFRDIDRKKVFRATLYEVDGYTEYRESHNEYEVVENKRGYIRTERRTDADGVFDYTDENYGKLPIFCLYANDTHESELVGFREDIDCYDFIKSGLANNIDDLSEVFWLIQGTGGMDDIDLAEFMHRLRTVHAAVGDGDTIQAQQVQIPTEARSVMLDRLERDIYDDFGYLDVTKLSASAKTTQEIKSAYQDMDNKCADFEYLLLDFVQKVLDIAGIDDTPSFKWQKIVNETEQTNMILSAAQYLPEDVVIKKLPFLTPEEAQEAIDKLAAESIDRFNDTTEGEEETEEEETDGNSGNIGDDE